MEATLSRRCRNCSVCVVHLRWRSLQDASDYMFHVLSTWITPTPVTRDDILCVECFQLLQSVPVEEPAPAQAFGHRSVCYGCGISILRSRIHRVSLNCPERNIILQWTLPHLIPRLERVCRACWMAAVRRVRRQHEHDINMRAEVEDITLDIPLSPPAVNEDVTFNIPIPPPLPPLDLLQPPVAPEVPKIISQTHRRALATTRHCIFTNCENPERLLIPAGVKCMLLQRYRFYVPPGARICQFHLNNEHWDQLDSSCRDFTATQVDIMLGMMERMSVKKLDFSNINEMPPNLCHYWLGLNAVQFHELMHCIPLLHQEVPNASVALSIFLAKMRTGDSNERLSTLFEMPRSTLERYMGKARNCLTQQLVPMYLGLSHMTVQEIAARNTLIPEGFYGNLQAPHDEKPAIVICDATYVYVQNSSNYLFQKETFSLHKHLNLVKPFMIVCCDGHILDCLGPFRATVNDATIMSHEFSNPEGAMRLYFRQGDAFILDRGFRDVVPELQQYGYHAHMPESLLEGEHQLTTEQANKSRCITMCRWVVEVVNGRMKRDFKLFRQEYFNRAGRHLMEDFRIGCALINKFHPIIVDSPHAQEYLNIALSRLQLTNHLGNYIRAENMNRRRAVFQTIDGNNPHLDQFPHLTLEDLKRLALGTYQLKQARSYYGEHMRQNGTYLIEINDQIEDDLPLAMRPNDTYLIRGRVRSRHVGSRTYYTYLLICRDEQRLNSLNAIVGYYCSCLVGNRTVGCCAHVMTVTWYLSWARHNDVFAPAQFLDNIFDEFVYENE